MFARYLITFSLLTVAAFSASVNNDTASNGAHVFSDHGDPNLVCRPAKWTDILAFFSLNYIAHAATLKSLPGEKPLSTILNILAALFFPTSGIFRGIRTFWSFAILADTDLEIAARAGALCTVAIWPPKHPGGRLASAGKAISKPVLSLFETSIHGRYELPDGYRLVKIPPDAKFDNDTRRERSIWRKIADVFRPSQHDTAVISCSYNLVKVLVALMQLCYASAELYQSRGEQIAWYGFSAFGLTVAPYAWMSFVNLCANLMSPDYPSMYLVSSSALEKLQVELKHQNKPPLIGVVGKLTKPSDRQLVSELEKLAVKDHSKKGISAPNKMQNFLQLVFTAAIGAVPIAIIGALSHFRFGLHSTAIQQTIIALWLLYGVCLGILGPLLRRAFEDPPFVNTWVKSRTSKIARIWAAVSFLLGGVAVYGLVLVGQMIIEYGVCLQIN